MKRFFTKKHLLSLTLALLLIMVLLGAGFLLIPRPTTRWTFQASGYVDSVFSPIESRGLLYILLQQPGLNYTAYALDASSGQVRWSFNIQGLIDTAPIVANGLLYVLAGSTVDRQSTLYALDAASGREQWSYQQALLSPPTIVNSIVYIHSGNGTLYAFNALTGDQLWSVPIGDNPFDTPIVANNLVYMVAGNGGKPESTVFALDAASGHTSWSLVVRSHYFSQLAVANGLVYLAPVSADAQVLALDAFSGTTRWSVQLAHQSEDANFLYTVSSFQVVNGIAYVDYQGMDPTSSTIGPGALSALNAQTGQHLWTTQTVSPEPTIANGLVYVYSGTAFSRNGVLICLDASCPTSSADAGNGTLSALDARTGRQQWSHPAVPFIDSSLTITPEPAVASGTVYVWTTKNNRDTLYALNAVSGGEQWSYQTGGSFSTSPTVAQGNVYTCLSDGFGENVQVIQPPGGSPGFSR